MTVPRSRPLAAAAGLTLIEMMIAVTVLAIGAAIVVPMVGGQAGPRLAAASRKILADLQYAQALAVSTRTPVYVRVAANQYDLCTLAGSTLSVMTNPTDRRPFTVKFGASAADRSLVQVSLAAATFGPNADPVLAFDAGGQPFAYSPSLNVATAIGTRSQLTLTSDGRTQPIYVEALTGEMHVP